MRKMGHQVRLDEKAKAFSSCMLLKDASNVLLMNQLNKFLYMFKVDGNSYFLNMTDSWAIGTDLS